MLKNEKGQPEGRPIPNAFVCQDSSEHPTNHEFAQALSRSVFGRGFVVERASLPRFRSRAPSRIRAWRAS
jgi:hypothetical protein